MYFNKYGANDANKDDLSDYNDNDTVTKIEYYNESLIDITPDFQNISKK